MRITPLEIRQHTFDKSFRGYDTESVDAFLLSLSQEWERVSEDFRQTKINLEVAEREILRMKEIENSLFKTLKAAEDAQQEINGKAQAEADLITDKAKKDAEEIANEAQKKADMVISEAENKAKFLVDDAINDLKNYERDFKAMERYKDYLVVELKSFANDALDKVTKFEERINTRTNEARLNDLGIKATESAPVVPVEIEPKVEEKVAEVESVDEPVLEQRTIQTPVNQEIEETPLAISPDEKEEIAETKADTEIDFEPANDYDDENEELPTVHAIVHEDVPAVNTEFHQNSPFENSFTKPENKVEINTDLFSETADNLMKEMKATRGRPRKIVREDGGGLPTVSSVMEEFSKDAPPSISNGGGSFFDNI
jgi:cell division initiation protein